MDRRTDLEPYVVLIRSAVNDNLWKRYFVDAPNPTVALESAMSPHWDGAPEHGRAEVYLAGKRQKWVYEVRERWELVEDSDG